MVGKHHLSVCCEKLAAMFSRPMWCDVAAIIRRELYDSERDAATRPNIARRARRFADCFKADNPAFSYDWFFGACGLDNWGEPLPNGSDRREE
jgi:hypothetical protein